MALQKVYRSKSSTFSLRRTIVTYFQGRIEVESLLHYIHTPILQSKTIKPGLCSLITSSKTKAKHMYVSKKQTFGAVNTKGETSLSNGANKGGDTFERLLVDRAPSLDD